MSNREIYGKTLPFSLFRILLSFATILVCAGIVFLGFTLTKNNDSLTIPVTTGAAILAIILYAVVAHYGGYLLRAGQIAMIARGVADGKLPDNVVATGRAAVKERFGTVSAFFIVTSIIRGIGRQVQRGLSLLTGAAGNDTVRGIGDTISALVSTVIRYASDCCLGWVFLHPEQNAYKSTCDGVSLYFRNWKTLLKNLLRIVGVSIVSLIVIGGPIFLLIRSLMSNTPYLFTPEQFAELNTGMDAATFRLTAQIIGAVLIWTILHAAFVAPYVLVSVMRAYLNAARTTPLDGEAYDKLSGMSKKFRTALERSEEPAGAAEKA